jgi:hypothetical protein
VTSKFSWRGRGGRRLRSPLPVSVVLIAAASVLAVPGAVASSAADVEITLAITGTLGMNGWYTSNVTVNWVVTGAANSSGCDAKTLTADTSGVTLTCSASNLDGTSTASKSRTFKIDKTPPVVKATPARPADKNGWYNHPLAVTFSGTDATSGIGACTAADYKGPDDPSAAVSGSCTDVAGNTGASKFALEYDATPPSLARLSMKAGNRTAVLAWTVSADTRTIEVIRRPGARGSAKTTIYRGRATGFQDRRLAIGTRYRYVVKARDQAGNAASKAAALTATGPLLSPLPGESVSSPPLLTWTRVSGARYYNVQLVRGTKILSLWPRRPRFRLPRSWTFDGNRYQLSPGTYHWYVWPGYGSRSASKYGRLLGGSSFTVRETASRGAKKHG